MLRRRRLSRAAVADARRKEADRRFSATLTGEQWRLYLKPSDLETSVAVFDQRAALYALGRHFRLAPGLVELVSEHVTESHPYLAATCCPDPLDEP